MRVFVDLFPFCLWSILSLCNLYSIIIELQASLPDCKRAQQQQQNSPLEFPSTVQKYAVGMARTSKLEFAESLDMGVPLDIPAPLGGDEDILILYQRPQALPKSYPHSSAASSSNIPLLSMESAVENCDYLNIILTDHSKSRNQCIALVPQYESYHIQKWMRVGGGKKKLEHTAPLQMVSRGYQSNGLNSFAPPADKHIRQNWELLQKYFATFDESLADLKPLVEKIAKDRTVVVMVCNFGQSELLVNFVCAANSRNLDISTILVFATDVETKALAESLGLTAFYDERVRAVCVVSFERTASQKKYSHKLTPLFAMLVNLSRTLEKCPKKRLVITEIKNLQP
jgi:hypothetical protein